MTPDLLIQKGFQKKSYNDEVDPQAHYFEKKIMHPFLKGLVVEVNLYSANKQTGGISVFCEEPKSLSMGNGVVGIIKEDATEDNLNQVLQSLMQ